MGGRGGRTILGLFFVLLKLAKRQTSDLRPQFSSWKEKADSSHSSHTKGCMETLASPKLTFPTTCQPSKPLWVHR